MPTSPTNERGFILIAALWLLILIGSIAALLLARSMTRGADAASAADRLRTRLVLESAVETVEADLLINGNRSMFAAAPADVVIAIGARRTRIHIGAESGKLDVNEGDLALIDRVLAGRGWDGASRAAFAAELQARRAAHQPLRSAAELRLLAAQSRADGGDPCLDEDFTVNAPRPGPDPAFVSADLARRLGWPATAGGAPAPIGPGTAISIDAAIEGGATVRTIVRFGGLLDQPLVTSAWDYGVRCGAAER